MMYRSEYLRQKRKVPEHCCDVFDCKPDLFCINEDKRERVPVSVKRSLTVLRGVAISAFNRTGRYGSLKPAPNYSASLLKRIGSKKYVRISYLLNTAKKIKLSAAHVRQPLLCAMTVIVL